MDALVFSEITNNLTNQKALQELANQLNIDSQNIDEIQAKLNDYLVKTTIKRACCLGRAGPKSTDNSTGISVKIPIPTDYKLDKDINSPLKTQFKYAEKTVYVPSELCDSKWKKYEPYCDNFMNIYCANQQKVFTELNNNNFDPVQWKLYAKECSCYAPPNPSYASAPRTCYMNGCADGDSGVYVDPSSRGKQCDMTICTSILNASEITSGGSTTINPTVQQNCGATIDKRASEQNTGNPVESKSVLSGVASSLFNKSTSVKTQTRPTTNNAIANNINNTDNTSGQVSPSEPQLIQNSTSTPSECSNYAIWIFAIIFIFGIIGVIVYFIKRNGNSSYGAPQYGAPQYGVPYATPAYM